MTTNTFTTRVVFPNTIRARRSLLCAFLSRSVLAAVSLAGLAGPTDRAVAQSTSSWNTSSGTWNTTSANWAGAGPVWVNGTASSGVFANTAASSTVTLGVDLGVGRINVAAGGTTPEALVIDILAGRDGNPAALWTGSTGITSSVAAAAIAGGSSPHAVGWTEDGAGGLSVAFAAPGDTNIDGQLDILDVADFLGTGLFDAGSYLPASVPAASRAVTPVPEPSSTVAAGIGLLLMARGPARRFSAPPCTMRLRSVSGCRANGSVRQAGSILTTL